MISITQDLKFKQAVVEYSFKYACRVSKNCYALVKSCISRLGRHNRDMQLYFMVKLDSCVALGHERTYFG